MVDDDFENILKYFNILYFNILIHFEKIWFYLRMRNKYLNVNKFSLKDVGLKE